MSVFLHLLLLCVGGAVGQTPTTVRPTPMPSVPVAQADYEALNKIFFDFDAYWAANASRHATCTASSAKIAFDTCFRGCDRFQCDTAGRVTRVNLGSGFVVGGAALQIVIQSQIGLLAALTDLTITLAGAVPTQVGFLTKLVSFSLIGQSATATSLPTTIGAWSKLTSLTLSTPSLTSLPTQIGRLTTLSSLLFECQGLVDLPTQLGQLQALKDIYVRVRSGVLPEGWSRATFVSVLAENANLSGKIPLFTFDGPPGRCLLRLNAFDTALSLCPLGCYCDRNIVPQPLPTLGSGVVVGRSDAGAPQAGSGNAGETQRVVDGDFRRDSGGSLDWVIAAFVVVGVLLGATVGAVVWLTIALRTALSRIAQQPSVVPEMHTARADDSVRAPSTTVSYATAPASGHYVKHASEIHEHMGGNSVRQYDALTAFEAGRAGANDNYDAHRRYN